MQLVLYLTPSVVTFSPVISGSNYPWLLAVGALRSKVRAGHLASIGSGETSSASVTLDNRGRQVNTLIGRPLRRRGDLLNDDGSVFFTGVIASLDYSPVLTLVLEA